MLIKSIIFYSLVTLVLLLQACGNYSFHLRETQRLSKKYQQIQLVNETENNDFTQAFQLALEASGGQLVAHAKTRIGITNVREGRRVVAYDKNRKPRIYLVYLKFKYQIKESESNASYYRINLDRTFVYDANYALGKAEEENKIRHDLYAEAARLILLKLKYVKK